MSQVSGVSSIRCTALFDLQKITVRREPGEAGGGSSRPSSQ
jgi:hypothetical protein